ncbi:hypothetical protein QTV44_002599 [Vibrio vulnificus]|nr:hypothetical protein [Vibrio vulnificus]
MQKTKLTNIAFKGVLIATFLFSGAIYANELMTVKEFEDEIKRIDAKQLSHKERVQALKDLKEIWKLRSELIQEIAQTKIDSAEKEKPPVREQDQQSLEKSAQAKKVASLKMSLIDIDVENQVYLSEMYTVAGNAIAEMVIDGSKRTIYLNEAVTSKKPLGKRIQITGYDEESVTYRDLTENKRYTVTTRTPQDIKNRIDYANQLREEYTKATLLGTVDVNIATQMLEAEASHQSGKTVPVSYIPQSFDSAK